MTASCGYTTPARSLPGDVGCRAWVDLDAPLALSRHEIGFTRNALCIPSAELSVGHVHVELGNASGSPDRFASRGSRACSGPARSRQLLECHARLRLLLAICRRRTRWARMSAMSSQCALAGLCSCRVSGSLLCKVPSEEGRHSGTIALVPSLLEQLLPVEARIYVVVFRPRNEIRIAIELVPARHCLVHRRVHAMQELPLGLLRGCVDARLHLTDRLSERLQLRHHRLKGGALDHVDQVLAVVGLVLVGDQRRHLRLPRKRWALQLSHLLRHAAHALLELLDHLAAASRLGVEATLQRLEAVFPVLRAVGVVERNLAWSRRSITSGCVPPRRGRCWRSRVGRYISRRSRVRVVRISLAISCCMGGCRRFARLEDTRREDDIGVHSIGRYRRDLVRHWALSSRISRASLCSPACVAGVAALASRRPAHGRRRGDFHSTPCQRSSPPRRRGSLPSVVRIAEVQRPSAGPLP